MQYKNGEIYRVVFTVLSCLFWWKEELGLSEVYPEMESLLCQIR